MPSLQSLICYRQTEAKNREGEQSRHASQYVRDQVELKSLSNCHGFAPIHQETVPRCGTCRRCPEKIVSYNHRNYNPIVEAALPCRRGTQASNSSSLLGSRRGRCVCME